MTVGSAPPRTSRPHQIAGGRLAAREGIEPGDILISYAGRKIGSINQLIDLVLDPWPGDSRAVVVERGTRTSTFEAPPGRLGVNIDLKLSAPDAPAQP